MGDNEQIDFQTAKAIANGLFVDVRSESEYAVDHIPGSVSLPIFSDSEREQIGQVYRQISPAQARFLGLEMIAPKLPEYLKSLNRRSQGQTPILYCWRGGMRSEVVSAMAKIMHIHCYRLSRGYKAYRSTVVTFFESLPAYRIYQLQGLTGVGKTAILPCLKELGIQTLDLEGMACNRGSVFGGVGLADQPSQKMFESLLWQELSLLNPQKPIIVECEGRRIGRLLLPDPFFQQMRKGERILVYDSLENRIERIIQEYTQTASMDEVLLALDGLSKSLIKSKIIELQQMLKAGELKLFIESLLVNYYDPFYRYPSHSERSVILSVDGAISADAALILSKFFTQMG